MCSQQYFINMWSLVSPVKLSPTKKLVSTENELEKENAIRTAPFSSQLGWPPKINTIQKLLQSQWRVNRCVQHPVTRGQSSEDPAEGSAWWAHGAWQSTASKRVWTKKAKSTEAGLALPTTSSPSATCSSHSVPASSEDVAPGHQCEEVVVLGTLQEVSPLSEEEDSSQLCTARASMKDCAWLGMSTGSSMNRALRPGLCWKQTSSSRRDWGCLLLEPAVDPKFLSTTSVFNRETNSQSDIFGN